MTKIQNFKIVKMTLFLLLRHPEFISGSHGKHMSF